MLDIVEHDRVRGPVRSHHRTISPLHRDRAKAMRREPTLAEKKLWRLLRSRQLVSWKFRRQEPVGPYILDFVCFSAKLVVEVDGGQHAEASRDAVRDEWLRQHGFKTVRYWNSDVLGNAEGVLTDLLAHLSGDPSPGSGLAAADLSHKGRGG